MEITAVHCFVVLLCLWSGRLWFCGSVISGWILRLHSFSHLFVIFRHLWPKSFIKNQCLDLAIFLEGRLINKMITAIDMRANLLYSCRQGRGWSGLKISETLLLKIQQYDMLLISKLVWWKSTTFSIYNFSWRTFEYRDTLFKSQYLIDSDLVIYQKSLFWLTYYLRRRSV